MRVVIEFLNQNKCQKNKGRKSKSVKNFIFYTNILLACNLTKLYGEEWGGPRPDDKGPYANGQPVSLMVASIEDYVSRNDDRPNQPQVNLTSQDVADHWKSQADPNKGMPVVNTFFDGQVSSSMFVGTGAQCTNYDMVIYSGHGNSDGPWLGEIPDNKYMVPCNYDWSSGITKWFINCSCGNLSDGPMDEEYLTKIWGQAMGLNSPFKNRLHSYMGYRSDSVSVFDGEFSLGGIGHGSTSGLYTCNARRIFVNILMHSDNECKAAKYPMTIGEIWLAANAKQWSWRAAGKGIAPAILNWYAVKTTGGSPVVYDYFLESFHAPFPGPGALGPEFTLQLKAHSQNFGNPIFR